MDLKQQTIDTYNRSAEKMAERFNNIGARVEDVERGFSCVEKEQPFVLEIGRGNGREAAEILKRTNRYLGIDVSESMVELARQTAPDGTFEVADVETYEFPSGIDIIFSFASRTYYFYTPGVIKNLAAEKYEVVMEDFQDVLEQKWFTMVLRKTLG